MLFFTTSIKKGCDECKCSSNVFLILEDVLLFILYFGYIIEMKDFVHMKGLRAEHMCIVLLQALLF
jgi:hypothetical protein